MVRKIFLRPDRDSLHSDVLASIVTSPSVSNVDTSQDCFQFSVATTVLDHALLLLGENKSRFGFDLRHYLRSAQDFMVQTSDGFISMPDGTPDFKRRFSEDLGVAIGSLLIVDALKLKWETISQIPTNKKLTKHAKTPDFVGFDQSGNKLVYECKGTTQPQQVDKCRQKAKQQLAEHHEGNVSKFALVTYVPISGKLIPPFLFISDPSVPLSSLTEDIAVGLHYLQVCQFAGLDDLVEPLRNTMARRFAIKESIAGIADVSWKTENEFLLDGRYLKQFATQISERPDLEEFRDSKYVGKWRDLEEPNHKFRVFTGVSVDQFNNVLNAVSEAPGAATAFRAPRSQDQSTISSDARPSFSLFSDGTLLLIE